MLPLIMKKSSNFAGSSSVMPQTESKARECDDQRIRELRNLLEPHSDNALTFTFVFDMLG